METVAGDPDDNVFTVPIAKVGCEPFAPLGMLKANVRAEGNPPRVTEAGSVEGTEDAVTLDICASVPGVPFAPLGILKANVRFEGVPPRVTPAGSVEGTEEAVTLEIVASEPGVPVPGGMLKSSIVVVGVDEELTDTEAGPSVAVTSPMLIFVITSVVSLMNVISYIDLE